MFEKPLKYMHIYGTKNEIFNEFTNMYNCLLFHGSRLLLVKWLKIQFNSQCVTTNPSSTIVVVKKCICESYNMLDVYIYPLYKYVIRNLKKEFIIKSHMSLK